MRFVILLILFSSISSWAQKPSKENMLLAYDAGQKALEALRSDQIKYLEMVADTNCYSHAMEVFDATNSQSEFKLVDDIIFDEVTKKYEYHGYVAAYRSSNGKYEMVYKLAFKAIINLENYRRQASRVEEVNLFCDNLEIKNWWIDYQSHYSYTRSKWNRKNGLSPVILPPPASSWNVDKSFTNWRL